MLTFVLLVSWVSMALSQIQTEIPPDSFREKATTYLKRYGYLNEAYANDAAKFVDALKTMQQVGGLKVTGMLDEETMKIMEAPRCSLADVDATDGKAKRYSIVSSWKIRSFTYRIHNYPTNMAGGLTNALVDDVIANAYKFWTDIASSLTITKSPDGVNGTFNIAFRIATHDDNYPFDGVSKVLGHGYYPPSGRLHFDDAETWSSDGTGGLNLFSVAVHEIGHNFGLGHSNDSTAVMWPYYKSAPYTAPGPDDINGMLAMYSS